MWLLDLKNGKYGIDKLCRLRALLPAYRKAETYLSSSLPIMPYARNTTAERLSNVPVMLSTNFVQIYAVSVSVHIE
ncbi:hypothetical protein SCP_0600310 [Sparassis crispa]|uniref:Uncharacterized protein n=1 Tax=Sparassis crispa TaxID=139825 RepID=A0A401GQN1_9APHY|nr:hypothetical protein SCP_0600310 [Sparassis crispa]GBE84054.1 hypothetical protein SCP_0600310 [Sparassis crispa]